MDLQGRVALITGGGGHIGAAICETLAELGAAVVVLDMAREPCMAVAGRVQRTYGAQTLPLVVDLTNEAAIRSVRQVVLDRFSRLDILVNCAALVGTTDLKGWAAPLQGQ